MRYFILLISFLIIIPNICLGSNLGDSKSVLDKVAAPSAAGYSTTATYDGVLGMILKTIFSLLGVFFLILMIYGGFLWMTDRGSSQQVEKAQKLITAAVIGMIIVLASYAISYFVLNAISNTTLKN